MASLIVTRILGESRAEAIQAKAQHFIQSSQKMGPFGREWLENMIYELEEMAQGGDPGGVRQYYPGWEDTDFQSLIGLIQRLYSANLGEGVTTHLSNTDEAYRIAKTLWGNQISLVDPSRVTDAYFEFRVILGDGRTEHLRQYKQGRWFYFDKRERDWNYASAY